MDEKETRKLVFKNIFFSTELVCDNCESKIKPREDVAFKDLKYGIVFCAKCRQQYLEDNKKD
jgi:hypothetical protein